MLRFICDTLFGSRPVSFTSRYTLSESINRKAAVDPLPSSDDLE